MVFHHVGYYFRCNADIFLCRSRCFLLALAGLILLIADPSTDETPLSRDLVVIFARADFSRWSVAT